MLAVTDNFKAAVNAATRNLDVVVKLIGKDETDYTNARIYSSKDLLLSLKIVDGQTTGGFSLGGTICPVLTAELHKTAVVAIGDKVKAELVVYNGGGNLTMASEFTVDNIKRKADGTLSVTALGNMIKLAKNYVSELTYPTTQLEVLEEIAKQTGYELHPLITTEMINDPVIQTAPVKGKAEDGTTLYYTRREMLGFAAAINGGAAYIDQYGRIGIARHNDTGETFTQERVLRETLTEPFTIESVSWSSTGLSYSLGDDYNENTIEFYNPLIYNARELIAHNIETDLIGFGYDGAIIKKQGCGYFEVGDIVHYVDINNTTHDLLILGIVYEFNDGFFSETLYSLTDTPTQREYTGSSVVTTSPSAPTPIVSDVLYDYAMLSDTSARCNDVTYTVEKDSTTGLISKISDSNGNSFEPTINSGIADVAMHNAVFWSVAMCRGISSVKLPQPIVELTFENSLANTGTGNYSVSSSGRMDYTTGITGDVYCYSAIYQSEVVVSGLSDVLNGDFTAVVWFKKNPYSGKSRLIWFTFNDLYYGVEFQGSACRALGAGFTNGNYADVEWHSCAIVKSGSRFATIFDGEETLTCDIGVTSNSGDITLSWNSPEFFHGYIDSLRLYSKALTGDELKKVLDLK